MFVTIVVLALALLMMVIERMRPGRDWPTVKGWWVRAIAISIVQVGIVFLAGWGWDRWMIGRSLWSLESLGTYLGAAVGYIVMTFIHYWWHRWRHEVPFLWRWFHQFHHSPQSPRAGNRHRRVCRT